MAHVITNEFYKDAWGTEEMRHVFSARTRYQRWLGVLAALARVQARLGIIPQGACDEINRKAKLEFIDLDAVKQHLTAASHTFVPLLKGLEHACENGAGEFLHFGTCTQDIQDTAVSLELMDADAILSRDLLRTEKLLIKLSQEHKNLTMAARADGRPLGKTTLGLKMADWLAEVRRDIARMKDMRKYIFVGLIHSSTGTMSGLVAANGDDDQAFAVMEGVMEELGLNPPTIGWSGIRDNFGHFMSVLGLLAGTLGRIANEIDRLSRPEIAELRQPENADSARATATLCQIAINNVPLGLQAMISEHERDTRSWRMDWHHISETSILVAKALDSTNALLEGLETREDRIIENLKSTMTGDPV
jgi:adenylosuccinate lyase